MRSSCPGPWSPAGQPPRSSPQGSGTPSPAPPAAPCPGRWVPGWAFERGPRDSWVDRESYSESTLRGWTLGVRPGHPVQTKPGGCWGHTDPSSSSPRPRRGTRRGIPEDTLAQPTQDSAAAQQAAPREWTTPSTAKDGEVGWASSPAWQSRRVWKANPRPWRPHFPCKLHSNAVGACVKGTRLPACAPARQAFLRDDSGGGVGRGRGRGVGGRGPSSWAAALPAASGPLSPWGAHRRTVKGRAWGVGPALRRFPVPARPT